jgi:hypothetical protein
LRRLVAALPYLLSDESLKSSLGRHRFVFEAT